jgi:hypothetical protein
MEAMITILLVILFVAFILRHLGKYMLLFLAMRMAKKFGVSPDAFKQSARQRKDEPHKPKQIIPDGVGEYVEFEEVK